MSQIAVHSRASRFPERRAQRRADAKARQEGSAALTPEQRIEVLDNRLGVGVGAIKERLKLSLKIAKRDAAADAEKQKKPKKEKTS